MKTVNYEGRKIEIGAASKCPVGGRVRWFRAVYIDGKYYGSSEHQTIREAVRYAEGAINAERKHWAK